MGSAQHCDSLKGGKIVKGAEEEDEVSAEESGTD